MQSITCQFPLTYATAVAVHGSKHACAGFFTRFGLGFRLFDTLPLLLHFTMVVLVAEADLTSEPGGPRGGRGPPSFLPSVTTVFGSTTNPEKKVGLRAWGKFAAWASGQGLCL
jgi:hypothetical protein